MTPERWKQIDELTQAALERGVVEREGFLDEACAGDDTLRREVESQIAYQQQASKFLEEPAIKQAADLMSESQTEIESMEGKTLGRYRILRTLGAGGMGDVYLAEDTRLKRKVALKLLPAEFTQDLDRVRRFEQEAQAASALNHPNIITIHEIGEAGGAHYIVTEYVPGETLRARMKSEPPGLERTLEIVLQVAGALAVAHEAGIIHRDIKPENVMVRDDGLVKVLDFGLAKLTGVERDHLDTQAPTEAQQVTASGVVLGTAAYMSPEQARGLKVDARTDIFSLGVVLYEMIAGHKPFEGVTTSDVIAAVLLTEPHALSRYSPDVPETLEWIVRKALAKEREERHQTVKDLALALTALKHHVESEKGRREAGQPSVKGAVVVASEEAGYEKRGDETARTRDGSAVQTISSTNIVIREFKRHTLVVSLTLAAIVIAAFAAYVYFNRKPVLTDKDTILIADFTNTTDDAVFDSALKQALALQLEQSPFLNIFSDERTRRALRYMGRSPDERVTQEVARDICVRQGVKAMLLGSIAPLGNHYVIALRAVNAQTGDVLAREQVEAESKDQVLSVVGNAAKRLRETLGESISTIQKFDAPMDVTTSSLEAFNAFSLGRDLHLKGKERDAIPLLKSAVALDPQFALGYGILAITCLNAGETQLAREYATKAFELRERASERERLWIMAQYYFNVSGEMENAIEAAGLLKQIYPRYPPAHNLLGMLYGRLGQNEKAVQEFQEAVRLDPNWSLAYDSVAAQLISLGRFAEAKEVLEQKSTEKLDSRIFHYHLYVIAFINGDAAGMKQQIDWASETSNGSGAFTWQAEAAAFSGQMHQLQEFSGREIERARPRNKQTAASLTAQDAARNGFLGNCRQARENAAHALILTHNNSLKVYGAIALALCGEIAQAQSLANELIKENPKSTTFNAVWVPTIRAAIEMRKGNPSGAVQLLQSVGPYESAAFFWPNYIRAQSYLQQKTAQQASAEFQKILDHRGWDPTSYLYPLAHLGLARAAMLEGDTAKARKSYQDFLALWKDADADLPILLEAKKEYERVK